jgi:hypothetical protein
MLHLLIISQARKWVRFRNIQNVGFGLGECNVLRKGKWEGKLKGRPEVAAQIWKSDMGKVGIFQARFPVSSIYSRRKGIIHSNKKRRSTLNSKHYLQERRWWRQRSRRHFSFSPENTGHKSQHRLNGTNIKFYCSSL